MMLEGATRRCALALSSAIRRAWPPPAAVSAGPGPKAWPQPAVACSYQRRQALASPSASGLAVTAPRDSFAGASAAMLRVPAAGPPGGSASAAGHRALPTASGCARRGLASAFRVLAPMVGRERAPLRPCAAQAVVAAPRPPADRRVRLAARPHPADAGADPPAPAFDAAPQPDDSRPAAAAACPGIVPSHPREPWSPAWPVVGPSGQGFVAGPTPRAQGCSAATRGN